MTVNKDDKVLVTGAGWAGSVATVIEVLGSGYIRVIRDNDPLAIVGIVVKDEWEPYEPAKPVVGSRVRLAPSYAGYSAEVAEYIGTVIPATRSSWPIAVKWDNGEVYNCLHENEVEVLTEEPNDALVALRAIRARLADNALLLGLREDILSIIANVKGV